MSPFPVASPEADSRASVGTSISPITARPARVEPIHDRLGKVRPVTDKVGSALASSYIPGRDVVVDEAMIPFKGRSCIKQYMLMKQLQTRFS